MQRKFSGTGVVVFFGVAALERSDAKSVSKSYAVLPGHSEKALGIVLISCKHPNL